MFNQFFFQKQTLQYKLPFNNFGLLKQQVRNFIKTGVYRFKNQQDKLVKHLLNSATSVNLSVWKQLPLQCSGTQWTYFTAFYDEQNTKFLFVVIDWANLTILRKLEITSIEGAITKPSIMFSLPNQQFDLFEGMSKDQPDIIPVNPQISGKGLSIKVGDQIDSQKTSQKLLLVTNSTITGGSANLWYKSEQCAVKYNLDFNAVKSSFYIVLNEFSANDNNDGYICIDLAKI